MKGSIQDYTTELYSLLMMEVENDAKSFVKEEFLAMDIEEADLLNASIEVERILNCGSFHACREKEQSNI